VRIAKDIGKVTLNRTMPEMLPGSYLLIRPLSRECLADDDGSGDTLVTYDQWSAAEGDLIGLVEGREATAPFWPMKVPYDSYNACILDDVDFEPILSVGRTSSEAKGRE